MRKIFEKNHSNLSGKNPVFVYDLLLTPWNICVRDRKPMTNSSIISIYSGINRCEGPYHKRINHLLWKYLWLSLMIGTLRYRNIEGEV